MAAAVQPVIEQPALDESVVLYDVPWDVYAQLDSLRGDSALPRMTYLEGTLEIMSPSRNHDEIKECLGRLVVAWAEENGLRINGTGSWTLKRKKKRRGLEADLSYLVGGPFDDKKRLPDLAIEVAWSGWKVDKLDVYRGLGIREVWVWRKGKIVVHVLADGAYVARDASEVLRGIDLVLVARLAQDTDQTGAVLELRASLRSFGR
jgi:Uma2 family endonuclease